MKLLAIDTSTTSCSVAVIEGRTPVSQLMLTKRETHSKTLLQSIDTVLDESRNSISDMEGFAVVTGPGSFTGLRIGLSTIKGLASATGAPVAGVSSLEALAYGIPQCDETICALIDARKNEVYAGFFMYNGTRLERVGEDCVVDPEALAGGLTGKTILAGTGAVTYQSVFEEIAGDRIVFLNDSYHHINAVNVGFIALAAFEQNDPENTSILLPNYIRKSDAEIDYEKKHGKATIN